MSVITYLTQEEYDVFVQKADAETTGTYWQLYTWLADALEIKGISSINPTVLWLRGAAEANAGRGAMSELIRTYSSTEYDLRYGGSVDATLMQQASDAVAQNLIADIKGELNDNSIKFGIPDITRIAEADARAVGETLFGKNLGHDESDTAFANNSAWSGALLFTPLQSDQTWRLMSPVSTTGVETRDTKINTLNDWRDVLFAYVSYSAGLKAAALKFASEGQPQQNTDLVILAETAYSYIKSYITSGGNGDLEAAVLDGTDNPTLYNAFKLIGDTGVNTFLDMLRGAAQGKSLIGSTNDANFAANARDFFSAYSPTQLQGINAKPLSDTLYDNAKAALTDINVRAALAGLSNIALTVSPEVADTLSLYNPVTGQGNITAQWLNDRDEMLYWVKLYGAQGAEFTERFSVLNELGDTAFIAGDYIYKDLATGLRTCSKSFN